MPRRPQAEAHPQLGEPPLQRQFPRALHGHLEEVAQLRAEQRLRLRPHPLLGEGPVHPAVPLPEPPHEIVQAEPVARAQAQLHVEPQRHQRALGVVADDGVGRILVLLVEPGPGVEGGVGHALQPPPRRAQEAGDGLCQQLQVGVGVDHPAAHQHQLVVIAGDPLEGPQQPGVGLPLQPGAGQLRWTDALDVPQVEILVAAQAEEPAVFRGHLLHAGGGKIVPGAEQGAGVPVLQATIPLADRSHQEEVSGERQLAEERHLRLADPRQVARQPGGVELGASADHHLVSHLADGKGEAAKFPHLHGTVDEVPVVLRTIASETVPVGLHQRQRGGHAPVPPYRFGRRGQLDFTGLRFTPLHPQEQAGAVEEGMALVEVGGADRALPRIDLVFEHQLTLGPLHLPALLVQRHHREFPAAAGSTDGDEVAGEIPDHVAAGDPGGEGDGDARRIGLLQEEADGEVVRRGTGGNDFVSDGCLHASIIQRKTPGRDPVGGFGIKAWR